MLDALEAVAEQLVEADGGLECPHAGEGCGSYHVPVAELCLPEAQLGGFCLVHGAFWVDVQDELDQELDQRRADDEHRAVEHLM